MDIQNPLLWPFMSDIIVSVKHHNLKYIFKFYMFLWLLMRNLIALLITLETKETITHIYLLHLIEAIYKLNFN